MNLMFIVLYVNLKYFDHSSPTANVTFKYGKSDTYTESDVKVVSY